MRFLGLSHILVIAMGFPCFGRAFTLQEDGFHVRPGENIQDALKAAAASPTMKVVKVHAGVYRPGSRGQALIWFNKRHDGIRLEAEGEVTLTAANPELSDPKTTGHPAVVNHVVYFGDGISTNTILKGFRITGANGFMTTSRTRQLEPDETLSKGLFFFSDGGGIKIFGRSYPTILDVEVSGNFTRPCGAGISIEHLGHTQNFVRIENCIFRNNRTQVTGAAVDLLPPGSAAQIINCLFVGNISNTGIDTVAQRSGEPPFTNSGVLTVFPDSRAWVKNCTFAHNRNAVDDMSKESIYENSIFSKNDLEGGLVKSRRYELDVQEGARVSGCFFEGEVLDAKHAISRTKNTFDAPSPAFDERFVPQNRAYEKAGYRPLAKPGR